MLFFRTTRCSRVLPRSSFRCHRHRSCTRNEFRVARDHVTVDSWARWATSEERTAARTVCELSSRGAHREKYPHRTPYEAHKEMASAEEQSREGREAEKAMRERDRAEKGRQTTQRGQRRHNNSRGTMIEWWEVELFCLSVETCLRCGVSQCRHRHATSTASGAWLPGTHARSCHWGLGLQVTKGRMSKLCRTQPSETARTRTNTTCAAPLIRTHT